jgi:hypothetical protein
MTLHGHIPGRTKMTHALGHDSTVCDAGCAVSIMASTRAAIKKTIDSVPLYGFCLTQRIAARLLFIRPKAAYTVYQPCAAKERCIAQEFQLGKRFMSLLE